MRRLVAAVGIVATVLGLAAIGGLTLGIAPSDAVLTMLGGLAVVQGLRSLKARRRAEFEQATTGDPERRYRVPTPGDGFPTSLGEQSRWERLRWRRDRLAEHLRETAIETLTLRGAYTRDQATEAVARGTWTDDPVAAAFLAETDVSVPVRERLREVLRGEPAYRYRAGRTIDALAEVQDGN